MSLTFHWTRTKLARSAGIQPGVDHHGPDDVWCADRRTRPTKRIEHAARQTSWFEPEIRLTDPLRWDRLRLSIAGANRRMVSVQMNQISAKLAELLLGSRAIIPAILARLLASADTT